MEEKVETVAAVVVTFNRLELLMKCIQSLRDQTRKLDEIMVVNNNSTDGTLEWLNSQSDLTVITQENSGSAGGQRTGIKTAYEKGYDWVWCLDDDCIADVNALDSFSKHLKSNVVLNSLVLSSDDPKKLAFGLYEIKFKKYYQNLSDIRNIEIIESQNFFNGSLFPHSILSITGFPLSELFIRGDEYEFFLRVLNAGYKVLTITKSLVNHPPEKKLIIKNRLFYYEFLFLDTIKRYYHIRNLFFITKRYDLVSYKYFFKNFFLDIIFIIVLQRKPQILIKHFKGLLNGLVMNVKLQ